MKSHFLSLVCFIIVIIFSTLVNAQNGVLIDTLLRTQWIQYADNPVIEPGSQPWWNVASSFAPDVIMYKDTLRMWYCGGSLYGFDGVIYIGYAWSLDGITWQQYSNNPVLSPQSGNWDYPHCIYPHIIADGDTLRMWYGGGSMIQPGMRIGYAASVDGINWNRYPQPVIEPNADWNTDGVLPGGVIKENGVFKMWFGGGVGTAGYPSQASQWNTGYATSSDGINWTLLNDPVISHGTSEDFDANEALGACVVRSDSGYDMWYLGHNSANLKAAIGYASSSDGINWTKYYNNPVLSSSSLQFPWAGNYYDPGVYFDGEIFHMWFTGWDHDTQLIAIGYAISDTGQYTGTENDLLTGVLKEYKLFQNYPNPFNPSTTIKYKLPRSGHVIIKVYNILGNEVAKLVDEYQERGLYSVKFESRNPASSVSEKSGLASGIYFYRIIVGNNFVDTRKMILMR